ncbi:MAG: trypsin-like serine protease [Archangiaceae bacterium]|nr:trypsin-like serine protease [Archangiaceae bacterium]
MTREGVRGLAVVCAGLTLGACGVAQSEGADVAQVQRQAVVAGKRSDAFEYDISNLEKNATLAQVVTVSGKQYQGCSATLVGDRLVLTAGHCVVVNVGQWMGGAAPMLGDPGMLQYVVGEDIDAPLCRLMVESLHLNPEIAILSDGSLAHDSAIAVLKESVTTSCPQVVPLPVNRAPVDSLVGQILAQGGFGSTNDTMVYSKVKFWSALQLSEVNEALLFGRNIDHGMPSFGDSGSGALLRLSDGVLRVLGTASTTWGNALGFSRLDKDGTFLDAMLTEQNVCGALASQGVCRGDTLVHCVSKEVRHEDCTAQGLQCAGADAGAAACACTCNQGAFCEAGCACDPDCAACSCDAHAACDEGCACDSTCVPTPAMPMKSGCSSSGVVAALPLLALLALARRRQRR